MALSRKLLLLVLPTLAAGTCYHTGPAFPVPFLGNSSTVDLSALYANLTSTLAALNLTDTVSYSIGLTGLDETLWTASHTAAKLGNYTDSPATNVTADTAFRIASVSKVFTVYSLLVQNATLADPITKHVPELAEAVRNGSALTDWNFVTLESLASFLSGLPREYGEYDLAVGSSLESLNELGGPEALGLPPVSTSEALPCGTGSLSGVPCTREQMLESVLATPPVFSPNHMGAYSNLAFDLLGLVLSSITNSTYSAALNASLIHPLSLTHTTTTKPADSAGVIPALSDNSWNTTLGLDASTGGVYSSVNDLLALSRSILTASLLPRAQVSGWLQPRSFNAGLHSSYGAPWEILRTAKTSADGRAVTLYGKGGTLNGYYSQLYVVPEFGIGLTLLTASDNSQLGMLNEAVTPAILRGVEAAVRDDVRRRYAGSFVADAINSSFTLAVPESGGLTMDTWVSNGTDVHALLPLIYGAQSTLTLVPTGLWNGTAERFWIHAQAEETAAQKAAVMSDFCLNDFDNYRYARRSLLEVQVSFDEEKVAKSIFLPGWQVEMKRTVNATSSRRGLGPEEL